MGERKKVRERGVGALVMYGVVLCSVSSSRGKELVVLVGGVSE